jgi:hypothetical protein
VEKTVEDKAPERPNIRIYPLAKIPGYLLNKITHLFSTVA